MATVALPTRVLIAISLAIVLILGLGIGYAISQATNDNSRAPLGSMAMIGHMPQTGGMGMGGMGVTGMPQHMPGMDLDDMAQHMGGMDMGGMFIHMTDMPMGVPTPGMGGDGNMPPMHGHD
jgi:hypothetical protein